MEGKGVERIGCGLVTLVVKAGSVIARPCAASLLMMIMIITDDDDDVDDDED